MRDIQWLNHKNRTIIFGDYTGLDSGDAILQMKEAYRQMNASSSTLLVLVDFTRMQINKEIIAFGKSEESRKMVSTMDKFAVVGLSAVHKIVLNSYNAVNNASAKSFANKEDAMDWLVKPKRKLFKFWG